MASTLYSGLDFGTSNSTFSITSPSPSGQFETRLVPLEGDRHTLPTAIFFNVEEGHTCFGRQALGEYVDGAEGRLMRAVKSVLGTSLMDSRTEIGHRAVSFHEIIQTFLAHVKAKAEAFAGQAIDQVVLGRPVRFIDDNDDADRRGQDALEAAARAAGFRDIAFQYEPMAAALDYEQQVAREELAVICDIGGGTSDFTVVRLSPEGRRRVAREADILGHGGVHLGGTNFDQRLSLREVMPLLGMGTQMGDKNLDLPVSYFHDLATWHRINLLYDRRTKSALKDIYKDARDKARVGRLLRVVDDHLGHQLAMRVEDAKIALAQDGAGAVDLDIIEDGLRRDLARRDLDEAVAGEVEKITRSLDDTLKAAGVPPTAIDSVFLTGGSTGIPVLRDSMLALFPQARAIQGDRFGSVGTGLSLDAARRFGGPG